MRSVIAICAMLAAPASADEALILGNARYINLDQLVGADDVNTGVTALARAGFDVAQMANGTGVQMRATVQDFAASAGDSARLVSVLMGQFATDGARTWFLPVDATTPSLFALDGAVSLESMMQLMVGPQGQSVLALGYDAAEDAAYDPFLREGIGALEVPQGMTVITGEPDNITAFLRDAMTPGANLMQLVADDRGLRVQGYVPDTLILVPATADQVAIADPEPQADPTAEQALWDGARALDTADAYRNYLTRYPQGAFADDATALIAEIETEPNRPARLAEEALNLSRSERRDVQRALTVMDFDPRGIDGIFGAGSRSAIQNWQQQNGYSQTTYLTREQITRLAAQAARRIAEREAEAERERQEQLRLDQAFWDETGAQADEAGLRAYLDRYPAGTYASQARELLKGIEDQARDEDNAAWAAAQQTDTLDGYQAYTTAFPAGLNISAARAEIRALQSPEDVADDVAGEDALGLNDITLRLIEARLAELGMEPGGVDGTFDALTREAISAFQQDRSLDVTGYLNAETVSRLLADSITRSGN